MNYTKKAAQEQALLQLIEQYKDMPMGAKEHNRLAGAVLAFAMKVLPNTLPDDIKTMVADDAATIVLHRFSRISTVENPVGYIVMTLHNVLRSYYRAEKKYEPEVSLDFGEEGMVESLTQCSAGSCEEDFLRHQKTTETFAAIIKNLSKTDTVAFLGVTILGYRPREISVLLATYGLNEVYQQIVEEASITLDCSLPLLQRKMVDEKVAMSSQSISKAACRSETKIRRIVVGWE